MLSRGVLLLDDLPLAVLLEELELALAQEFTGDRNHVEGVGIHEVVDVPVSVRIVHRATLQSTLHRRSTALVRISIGIEDADAALIGCAKAGSSTALGFVSAQSLQNLVTPQGQCWVD